VSPAATSKAPPRVVLDLLLIAAGACLAILIIAAAIPWTETAPDEARSAASLRLDPLNLIALRELGLRQDRQGRLAEAEATFTFVAGRTWRDAPTEAWLVRRRLGQGRLEAAFENADSLLRQDADQTMRPILFPMLTAAAAYVEARPVLEARLALAPPWRSDFLRELGTRGEAAGAARVFVALASGGTPPTPREYAPLINRLVSGGRYRDALDAWSAITGPAGAAEQALRDGDFTGTPDGTAFTWSAAEGVGATSEVGQAPAGSPGRALRVDYDGFSSPALPAQLLVLAPGRYRLAWREQTDPAGPDRLYWRLRCADSGQALARASALSPTPTDRTGWRAEAMDLEIPAASCVAQWLELIATPGEKREPTTAWYAAFRLVPEG
jgi:hypothetical protein